MAAGKPRRRPAVQITTARAARLYRLVRLLADGPRQRSALLKVLGIGLRTFYREVELLRRVSIRVRLDGRAYVMQTRFADAETRLPFPDPRLTFAEIRILSQSDNEVGGRLSALYQEVLTLAEPPPPEPSRAPRGRGVRRQ